MTTTAMTTEPEPPEAGTPPPRRGLSVRARITASVALLVTLALAGAGLIVYVVELGRVEAAMQREVEQELDEFAKLRQEGVDPETGAPFNVEGLLLTFLRRNVPDDDELLVAWVDGRPRAHFPEDPLVTSPRFRNAVDDLVLNGGTTYLDTSKGEVRITSQPVRQDGATGTTEGALLVVSYLDEDRAELRSTMGTYTIVAGLLALLVTLVAAWQSGRLLAPLTRLRHATGSVSATDLSARLPESGNDDISALTRNFNDMLARLEQAFTDQRQFLDDAGHELRTPLTIIGGHLELLDESDPTEVEQTRRLALDEVDRMSRLVGDLILLAKHDRPDFLTLEEVDVDTLTEDILAKASALADRDWHLDAATPGTWRLDPQRVTQAMLQLCDNAVGHTSPGDQIAVGSETVDDTLRLWVRDTGPGVPAEDRERIFERFARGAEPNAQPGSGDRPGLGLGLAIVSAIAGAHGGTVGVEDATPSGARFTITLPARTEGEAWPAS
ncbi:HAMP domain-containing sensor histidine kinase [Nocardioides sp.]|uniref:sensor histidine kinase n=1 Tax=Nocardioides sp. TaxID=35761 RepID=UPI0019A1C98D|nr:HAMP domain-containing sensor histidine kinase [Nocardioides sp.]MBC7279345.1 HAMP domain-containing histidine kinase [Nocardioides sp.]